MSAYVFISHSAELSPNRPAKEIAAIVFGVVAGSVSAVAGTTCEELLLALDNSDFDRDNRRALSVPLKQATSAEQIVEQVTDMLAETALRMWPMWFTDVDFGNFRDDTLGREAARVAVRDIANRAPNLLRPWAEAAVMYALSGRKPRVQDLAAAVEIEQLCLAISRAGLVLIFGIDGVQAPAATLVHALEWMSQNARVAVLAVFAELPDDASPFDRILHGAIRICQLSDENGSTSLEEETASDRPWLAPVRGIPHPLSETEQRLAKALARDGELAPLFGFNQFVDTVRGNRPKVDLLWTAGRLVVELDGYADHGTRGAFMRDRQRDYELMLTGYTVLRLANDEIGQDIHKAVEKIRDMVQLCRARRGRSDNVERR